MPTHRYHHTARMDLCAEIVDAAAAHVKVTRKSALPRVPVRTEEVLRMHPAQHRLGEIDLNVRIGPRCDRRASARSAPFGKKGKNMSANGRGAWKKKKGQHM